MAEKIEDLCVVARRAAFLINAFIFVKWIWKDERCWTKRSQKIGLLVLWILLYLGTHFYLLWSAGEPKLYITLLPMELISLSIGLWLFRKDDAAAEADLNDKV